MANVTIRNLGDEVVAIMLPPDIHLWYCPCPVGVALPSGNGGRFTSTSFLNSMEGRIARHARRT